MNLTDIQSSPSQYSEALSLFPLPKDYSQSNQLIQFMISNDNKDRVTQIKEQLREVQEKEGIPTEIKIAMVEGFRSELKDIVNQAKRSRNHRAMVNRFNTVHEEYNLLVRMFEKLRGRVRQSGVEFKNLMFRKLECMDMEQDQGKGIKTRNQRAIRLIGNNECLIPKCKQIAERISHIRQVKMAQLTELVAKMQSLKQECLKNRNSLSPKRNNRHRQTMLKRMAQIEQQCEDKQNHNGYLINRC